jgi:putative sporulation protein YyaC
MNPIATPLTSPIYIHINEHGHFHQFCSFFSRYLEELLPQHKDQVVFVCIGTDRATGDCLGPLVGHKLESLSHQSVTVYGNLDQPVHAKNLNFIAETLKQDHPHALIVAIDACLGHAKNVGCISIGEGPIAPGAGVKKELPAIGDLHITGIVNFSSLMNMVVLQNTRLSVVMRMADIISSGIRYCLWQYYQHQKI